jgi:transcriptional regulator with XRE-family HTH domain
MPRRAVNLLRDNVRELLRERGYSQKDLAFYMKMHPTTISKFLKGQREVQLDALDDIANFFGLVGYQLFQPGITKFTERRSGQDRRSGEDRRISHMTRMRDLASDMRDPDPRRPKHR